MFEGKTNEELLKEYLETKDTTIKQEIVMRYSYIVKTIAVQMRGVYLGFAEVDDMISEGIIALMGAVDKFDFSKNVKFESYASLRIRGTIIDIARKQDWVPRNVRKTGKAIDNAVSELFSKLGRYPTEQEIADHLGMDKEKYLKALGETNLYNVLSLDSLMDTMQSNLQVSSLVEDDQAILPGINLETSEMKDVLIKAISGLKENEQKVVSLYYRKDLSMREISRVLDISEPRVSQIHASALKKLKVSLENYKNS